MKLLLILVPIVFLTAQPRPAATTRSKARDREWVKSQLRKRYGTAAVPEKTPKKSAAPDGSDSTAKKDSSKR